MSDARWPEWLRHGRMFTTDGHMYDTRRERVDIRRIARTIAACHGNIHRLTAHTFMGWSYYDSRLGPKAPGLGDQDWLAEAKDEGARRGVKLLAYFNMLGYLDDHPLYGTCDSVDERGDPIVIYRVVRAACINSPWRQAVLDVVAEVFQRYAPDGMYIDWAQKICWCGYCRDAFRRLTGEALPGTEELAARRHPDLVQLAGGQRGDRRCPAAGLRRLAAAVPRRHLQSDRQGRPEHPAGSRGRPAHL
jgi:hypothetical protein